MITDNVVFINSEFIHNLTFDELMQFKKVYKLKLPLMGDKWYVEYNKVGFITYKCEDQKTILLLKLKYGDVISD